MDPIMSVARPGLRPEDAVRVAAEAFGVTAADAQDLGSERDATFRLLDAGGEPVAVLKASNVAEDPAVLDMEAAAALHVHAVDPGLGVALPRRAVDGADDVTGHRATWTTGEDTHLVRLYDALPGSGRTDPATLDDAALVAWGETTGRLALALRGFFHPRAQRVIPWDVSHALSARTALPDVRDPRARAAAERAFDAFEAHAVPRWPRLRGQVLHADLTMDNVLCDERGRITGIVDFGDMNHTTLAADLAPVLDSMGAGRDTDDLLRGARLVLDGYQRHVPLEDEELAVLGLAWAARGAVTIAVSSWRVAQGLEEQAFAERCNADCLRILEAFEALGHDAVATGLGARGTLPDDSLRDRRAAAFGPAVDPLFYDQPVQVASASGVWVTSAAGERLLDAYNNVPCVGHAHPRVLAAAARQGRRINTHTRYLHPAAIELAERLAATCPPELDTVLLVNSGSEANDLAWRMATMATGNTGGLCTAFAYHGITEATAALSPEGWLDGVAPQHVETWRAPDAYRGTDLDASAFAAAVGRLRERGHAPAAMILDGLLTSDSIADPDPGYVQALVRETREAGGLYIADEVQAGHGRTGEALWCVDRFGVVPDFITLGKPMGNGHPVAAVITKSSIVRDLVGRATLFSTFGGNPVSASAALAVLDVLEDERVLERVDRTGRAMRAALRDLQDEFPGVGDVRGVGLAVGVELVTDRDTREPDGPRAAALRDGMRRRGVLVGTSGPHKNTIKIRPPLAFTEEHVPVLVDAMRAALAA